MNITYGFNQDLYSNYLTEIAKTAAEVEQHLPPLQAVKAYPMAIFWSLVVSMGVIMESYDTSLIGNFFAYPSFVQKYGTFFPGVGYQLTAARQAGLSNATGVGSFFGVLANGYLVSYFRHKRVLIGALFAMAGFIFIMFFAPNIQTLTAVLPLSLRVHFTSYTNMCFIIGQLIASGVLEGLVHLDSQWAYRIPYALQWVWPCKLEEAERNLRRLQSKHANIDLKLTLATIVHTNKLEQELSVGTSYWGFKGFEPRGTEIACMVFCGQITSGICFAYFFKQVGLTTSQTYKLNVWGMGLMTAILFIIGILNVWTSNNHLGWALPAEIGSTRLRQKTVCLARNTYYLVGLGLGTLEPYFINPTKRPFNEIDILFAKGVSARKFGNTNSMHGAGLC
ncbi:hypothetical protein V1515DRAFT_617026 [Lipomyces mesembrius]